MTICSNHGDVRAMFVVYPLTLLAEGFSDVSARRGAREEYGTRNSYHVGPTSERYLCYLIRRC